MTDRLCLECVHLDFEFNTDGQNCSYAECKFKVAEPDGGWSTEYVNGKITATLLLELIHRAETCEEFEEVKDE